ncbi:MAG: hypothetical protein Q8O34_08855 [Rhodocyclaceae bacterium]|nr:hypothetical protein [Rhodocyclaceae bacterium]
MWHSRIVIAGALAGLLSAPALAGKAYCCNDESGHRICGDVLPAACIHRAYQIKSGGRIENVEAPPTPEQKVQREAEKARKKEVERRTAEEHRINQALLGSYGSEKDFDNKRDRALAEARKTQEQVQERHDEAVKRQQKLANEAEFYQKKPMPDALKAQIKENETELSAQQSALDARKQDIENIRAKFEAEKKRYHDLTRGDRSAAAPASRPR